MTSIEYTSTSAGLSDYKVLRTHDSLGRITQYLHQKKDEAGAWVTSYVEDFSYDEFGNITKEVQTGDDGIVDETIESTYDSQQLLTQQIESRPHDDGTTDTTTDTYVYTDDDGDGQPSRLVHNRDGEFSDEADFFYGQSSTQGYYKLSHYDEGVGGSDWWTAIFSSSSDLSERKTHWDCTFDTSYSYSSWYAVTNRLSCDQSQMTDYGDESASLSLESSWDEEGDAIAEEEDEAAEAASVLSVLEEFISNPTAAEERVSLENSASYDSYGNLLVYAQMSNTTAGYAYSSIHFCEITYADEVKLSTDGDGDYIPFDVDCDDANNTVGMKTKYFQDTDGDSYGDAQTRSISCSAVSGAVTNSDDCDDTNASFYDADVEFVCGPDSDSDGYGSSRESDEYSCHCPTGTIENTEDCDDTNSAVKPGVTEVCDEIDNDCDGSVDEDLTVYYYPDLDGDGKGDEHEGDRGCTIPAGYVDNNDDCDDTNPAIYEGAVEVAGDGVNNDCDYYTDEFLCYRDADGDGYGGTVWSSEREDDCPYGYIIQSGDCDDDEATAYPHETRDCLYQSTDADGLTGVDDDCDGSVDVDTWRLSRCPRS